MDWVSRGITIEPIFKGYRIKGFFLAFTLMFLMHSYCLFNITLAEAQETEEQYLKDAEGVLDEGIQRHSAFDYAGAEDLYRQYLRLIEKRFGKESPKALKGLMAMGRLHRDRGLFNRAEALFRESLRINQIAYPGKDPERAKILNELASLFISTARYVEAEEFLRESLEIREVLFGEKHTETIRTLANFASLYKLTGRVREAEDIFKRVLQIREETVGKEHMDYARTLNEFGIFLDSQGRRKEAEPLLKESIKIRETVLGRGHPEVANSLSGLAMLYRQMGRQAEAQELLLRALAIRENALGRGHPKTANTLNSMAGLYRRMGMFKDAESLYNRALLIRERTFGKDSPAVASTLLGMAGLYASKGQYKLSQGLYKRALEIQERTMEDLFSILSDRQRINYLTQNRGQLYALLDLTTLHLARNKSALEDAFNRWIRWKGMATEAMGRHIELIADRGDIPIQEKFQELRSIRSAIAGLLMMGQEGDSNGSYLKKLKDLQNRRDLLEAQLYELSKPLALEGSTRKAVLRDIAGMLNRDGVYIDFIDMRVYNFRKNLWGNRRYRAFVMLPDAEPSVYLLDLADAERVDGNIKEYLQEMRKPEKYRMPPRMPLLKSVAQQIYLDIIKPIEPFIRDRKHLYVSPDGLLNLIPFEILTSPEGRMLMDDYGISYVAAGRDMVRFREKARSGGLALIMADPDYDMDLKDLTGLKMPDSKTDTANLPMKQPREMKNMRFTRLTDTNKEADAIETILKGPYSVKNYQREKATESELFREVAPTILHLATHGYFLRDDSYPTAQRDLLSSAGTGESEWQFYAMDNPMLRSGIVLAGANTSLRHSYDYGLVSADKLLGLNLKGTELVVLSACETGVGVVHSGEGVYGLKRAFILSGAKTMILSLWNVPSIETTELMTMFYKFWKGGKSKSEALRLAKMQIQRDHPNPFYWGAFILIGEPL